MRRAFARKDPAFDGTFIVAVKTTNVFCRPVCRAKPPRAENVEFFRDAREAVHHGYRPCKLCRPLNAGARPPEVVEQLLALVDERWPDRLAAHDLRAAGIDPSTARRRFRGYCGMTFAAYQRARRMGRALAEVRSGAGATRAQVGAGYESANGFRGAFARIFGRPSSDAVDVRALTAKWIETPLGRMVAIADEAGIVLVDFVDRRGLETAIQRVRRRFGAKDYPAAIVPGEHPHLAALDRELGEYFARRRTAFDTPLNPAGTPFEKRVWEQLRTIPHGQTRSYSAQAKAIGSPAAVRAVARANGMNYLSIVIPCHRVIGADGQLVGYGGGLARKRWLLDHERSRAATRLRS